MRDDSARWDTPRDPAAAVDLGIAGLTPVQPIRQTLVSGPGILSKTDLPLVEWPGAAPEGAYALSLRRDRVLLVDGPELMEGWDEEKARAVSDASDAYAVFDLSGPGAFDILRRGAELRLDIPSRSVARMLFGLGVFLYRLEDRATFRLHVARAQAEALVGSLGTAGRQAAPGA